MKVILSKVTNQHREEVVDKELLINPKEGKIWVEELNCYSSIDLGMGTCRCVSHPLWNDPYEISPDGARELVKKAYQDGYIDEKELQEILDLIDKTEMIAKELEEQKEKYYKNNPIQLLLDHFGIKSKEELENYILGCYKLGINPLPPLRKVLKEYGWDIFYFHRGRDLNGDPEPLVGICGKTIGCFVWWDGEWEEQPVEVILEVGDGLDYDSFESENENIEYVDPTAEVDFIPENE